MPSLGHSDGNMNRVLGFYYMTIAGFYDRLNCVWFSLAVASLLLGQAAVGYKDKFLKSLVY